jgi:hypothetical protein
VENIIVFFQKKSGTEYESIIITGILRKGGNIEDEEIVSFFMWE